MLLRFYAITAMMLFLALGVVLSAPETSLETTDQTFVSPDTVETSRATNANDLSVTAPLALSGVSENRHPVGLVQMLKEARDRGASPTDIQTLLNSVAKSGRLHLQPLSHSLGQPYKVQQGDTLTSIAVAHYGQADAALNIYSENRNTLTSLTNIPSGTVLRLP